MVSADEFKDWLGHPATEWVLALCAKQGRRQKAMWADMAWRAGTVDPLALTEARVRADCYAALPESTYDDWKAIHDSED